MKESTILWAFAALFSCIIAFALGANWMQKSMSLYSKYRVDPLIQQYNIALSIAGEYYENHTLDVDAERDDWNNSIEQAQYAEYCDAIDSISKICAETENAYRTSEK